MYLGNDCFEDLRSTNIINRSKGGIPKNILTEGYLKGDETKYATYTVIIKTILRLSSKSSRQCIIANMEATFLMLMLAQIHLIRMN